MSVRASDLRNIRAVPRPVIWKVLVAVTAVAVLARLFVVLSCAPVTDPDTPSYLELANHIRSMSFSGWDGSRTPLYPLLLLISGANFNTARILQTLVGIATAGMLSFLVATRTWSASFAALAGMAYALNLGQMSFESAMMTETLCTFFLLGSVVALERTMSGPVPSGWKGPVLYGGLGVLTGLTALTRPMYAFLVLIYFAALLRQDLASMSSAGWRSRRLGAFMAPAAGLILAWCIFNWFTVGYFGLMSTVGFGLSNQSGEFIELAPDRYAAIREPYIRAVQKQVAETGSRFEPIFDAAPEIYRERGWSDVELSRRLTRMSIEMFMAHPLLYARGIWHAWKDFWRPGAYFWKQDQFYSQRREALILKLWKIQKRLWFAGNVVFLLFAGWSVLQLLSGRLTMDFDCYVIAVVIVASLVQAAMELGENSRYSVPTVPLVFYVVTVGVWRIRKKIAIGSALRRWETDHSIETVQEPRRDAAARSMPMASG